MLDNYLLNIINPPLANGNLNEAEAAFARWQQFERDERQEKYIQYRDYYDGDHSTVLTERQKTYLQVKAGQTFDANYCQIVVDALAERFIVKGFEADSEDGEPDDNLGGQDGWLWRIWQANHMDAMQGDLHTAVIRDGDTFALVEWDNGRKLPAITHEMAYNGTDGVSVVYQNERRDRVWFAFKKWQALNDRGEQFNRLNIYTDNAIYKLSDDLRLTPFSRLFYSWKAYRENEADPWPIPWMDSGGRPLGVPVFHFKHKANGYSYGLSRLDNVIPMQNALNKSIIDLLAAADVSAFRILTMLGAEPVDSDGNPLKVTPGGFIWSQRTPSEAAIGHIPGEDSRPFIDLVDSFVMRIAQMSRTPLSYFQATGQVASDETQEANEGGLVSIARQESTQLGNAWEDVMSMARRLHNAFGEGGLNEAALIRTVWDDFKRVNEEAMGRQTAETDNIKATTLEILLNNGISRELAAEMAGYPQEIVQRLREDVGSRRLIPASVNGAAPQVGTEAAPANLDTTKGLNGAQVTAALEVLSNVASGTMPATVATELLVSIGVERPIAVQMVADTVKSGTPLIGNNAPTRQPAI